ncbi:MAG TPA: ABC transporter ATP-binding protein [Candidatus Limnocylindria bacterium]|nr:ABC transporter ATP-binding protein [Candidatus Limnocylindria bacterium]
MSALSVHGLRVRRAGRDVLSVDSLGLAAGETLAIVGPNGAGKTTLILALAALVPYEGEVLAGGAPIRDPLAYRRRIAMVFQRPLLLDRSVLDNAALGLELRGVGRRERHDRAREALARLGIAELADRRARGLSGGEAQRVSLARALAVRPEILFLDEPFSALDAPTRERLVADLGRVLRADGVTTVLVTHDRDEALSLGDSVGVLIAGRLRQVGPAADVFAMPADPEVAAFVGVENVLPARVERASDELTTLRVADVVIEVTAEPPAGDALPLLCVRPDDVVISRAAPATSARNAFPGRILRLEPLGRRMRVVLDCGFPLVAHVTAGSARELALREGETVTASFKATAPHLLPRPRAA